MWAHWNQQNWVGQIYILCLSKAMKSTWKEPFTSFCLEIIQQQKFSHMVEKLMGNFNIHTQAPLSLPLKIHQPISFGATTSMEHISCLLTAHLLLIWLLTFTTKCQLSHISMGWKLKWGQMESLWLFGLFQVGKVRCIQLWNHQYWKRMKLSLDIITRKKVSFGSMTMLWVSPG